MRRRAEMASPGCSMIGAVAGFGPSVRMAPVGVEVRMLPVIVRIVPLGVGSDAGAGVESVCV